MFLRKLSKTKGMSDINSIVHEDEEGNELSLEEIISSDYDLVLTYEQEEMYKELRYLVNELPDRKREIIRLYYGFYHNTTYTQTEIASRFHISQRQVSRIIQKTLKELKAQLVAENIVAVKDEEKKALSISLKNNV